MIDVMHEHTWLRFPIGQSKAIVRQVLRGERKKVGLLSIVYTGDAFIKRINTKFLNHPHRTDTIAFSLGEGNEIDGEIYVNLDRARAQARVYGVSFGNETMRLLIHATLHLAGYRDTTKKERNQMTMREDFYLARQRMK